MMFLASSSMLIVAQFADLEYDNFLSSLPDRTQRLLFGLQLCTSHAEPPSLRGFDDSVVFYHMLAYRRALCLHSMDPSAHPLPSKVTASSVLDSGSSAPADMVLPPSFDELEKLASAARGRYLAQQRESEKAAATCSASVPAGSPRVYLLSQNGEDFSVAELVPSRELFFLGLLFDIFLIF
jgi:hypothetical protein